MTSLLARFTTNIFSRLSNNVNKAATNSFFHGRSCINVGILENHGVANRMSQQDFQVEILPALSDNYMYLIVDKATNEAAVVDPVTPETIVAAVKDQNVNLTSVLITHHHWDHAGGNKNLKKMMPHLLFYGGDERIDCLTNKVTHDTMLKIGNLDVKCLFTPCHTTGHICYYVTSETESDDENRAVFTGDTLFIGGCGRFFEGTPEQMNTALNVILARLPDDTMIYCGHEYTIANLKFGLHVEPKNKAMLTSLKQAQKLRSMTPPAPTVPSSIGREKHINPFMRVDKKEVREHSGNTNSNVETMTFIRKEKDNFKPV